MAEGGYDPVAERVFNEIKVDALFINTTRRARGAAPLRHFPKNKVLVLGLVSTKTPHLESQAVLKQRIEEASRRASENLCLSPQCGFSSNYLGIRSPSTTSGRSSSCRQHGAGRLGQLVKKMLEIRARRGAMNALMKALERALALAFIFAVCLNFANVIGRYVVGRSIAGADEIQIYIMVAMAFLGAGLVAWRRNHLRMDVLVRFFPQPTQKALRALEIGLVVLLAGFTLVQSARYLADGRARPRERHGRHPDAGFRTASSGRLWPDPRFGAED